MESRVKKVNNIKKIKDNLNENELKYAINV